MTPLFVTYVFARLAFSSVHLKNNEKTTSFLKAKRATASDLQQINADNKQTFAACLSYMP